MSRPTRRSASGILVSEHRYIVTFSVNEAKEQLDDLADKDISARGMLSFEFEDVSLSPVPLLERAPGYDSAIWLAVGNGGLDSIQRSASDCVAKW